MATLWLSPARRMDCCGQRALRCRGEARRRQKKLGKAHHAQQQIPIKEQIYANSQLCERLLLVRDTVARSLNGTDQEYRSEHARYDISEWQETSRCLLRCHFPAVQCTARIPWKLRVRIEKMSWPTDVFLSPRMVCTPNTFE
jgi:hypothetical protein